MEYEDTRTIATPEGVELELRLAGVGSRFSAALIDFAIQGALVIAVVVIATLALGATAAAVVSSLGVFFAFVVYDVLFEVRAAGRTPGKRALGLRVIMADGGPVTLRASAVRNTIRLVEGVATSYVPAILSILLTRDNQRLGDLAAGTVVGREAAPAGGSALAPPRELPERLQAWDVSAVTPQELAAVRSFLARRSGFEPGARADLAGKLAAGLAGRVSGPLDEQDPERFLEDVAEVKSSKR
jgi:uncharacterized RDD family membrane protein YckC